LHCFWIYDEDPEKPGESATDACANQIQFAVVPPEKSLNLLTSECDRPPMPSRSQLFMSDVQKTPWRLQRDQGT
jgi:hypothetical protein